MKKRTSFMENCISVCNLLVIGNDTSHENF